MGPLAAGMEHDPGAPPGQQVFAFLKRMVSWILSLVDLGIVVLFKEKLFANGVGDLSGLNELFERSVATVDIDFSGESGIYEDGARFRNGSFTSPLEDVLPDNSKTAYVLEISPPEGVAPRGLVIMMTHFGDQGYSFRREKLAKPLAKVGYISMLLMLPFYAKRKPVHMQKTKSGAFLSVRDMLLFSSGNIAEGAALIHWARRVHPGLPVGISGISFGGGMATASAVAAGGRLALAELMGACGPHTITQGVLRSRIDWSAVKRDLGSNDVCKRLNEIFEANSLTAYMRKNLLPRNPELCAAGVQYLHDRVITPELNDEIFATLSTISDDSLQIYLPGGHAVGFRTAQTTHVNLIQYSFEMLDRLGTACK